MNDATDSPVPLNVSIVVLPGGDDPDAIYAFSADSGSGGELCVRTRSQGYWSIEENLGGAVTGGIGAAVGSNGAVTALYAGPGGTLNWRAQQADGSWTDEQNLGLTVVGDVTAFTGPDGKLQVFYAGEGTTLRWLSQRSDGSWAAEQNLGGLVGGAVTVLVAPGSALMQLFYRGGASGEVKWRAQNVDGTWPGETGLGGMALDRVAAIVLPDSDVLQIFYRRVPDSQIESCYRDGIRPWTIPRGLGEVLSTNVAVAAVRGSQVVQLFFGGRGELYSKWRESDGRWSDHQGLGGIVGCDPVACIVDTQLQVFYRRTGQTIWSRTRGTDGIWSSETNAAPVSHVFVLMLENHSFDNIFGRSRIPNLEVAPTDASNYYWFGTWGRKFVVDNQAPMTMPYSPEHGFSDVVTQLCGDHASYPPGGPYPPITTSGFVANYVESIPAQSDPSTYGDVMQCFDTQNKLPVLYQLATTFTVCDHWFSSLPSSTWPNRFFVHAASSGGRVGTPSITDMIRDYSIGGVTFPNGTVFQAIDRVKLQWRIYNDEDDDYSDHPDPSFIGSLAQVGALAGINHVTQVHSLRDFAADLAGDYPYQYTFIEPNYGDEPIIGTATYRGGSSQHPVDDMSGGEALMKAVYEAIRGSSLWQSSVLIITYDEHGGFYDSAKPPGNAPAPNDGSEKSANNTVGFTFTQYGPRVPAVVISPWISSGVNHETYDHASVSATLSTLFGTPNLTDRDLSARDLLHLLNLSQPRDDTPSTLRNPAPTTNRDATERSPVSEDDPLPENDEFLQGFLGVALVTRLEICADDEAARQAHIAEALAIRTRGHARRFLEKTHTMIAAARASGNQGSPADM